MGCGCGSSSASATPTVYDAGGQPVQAFEYEVTYNNGSRQMFGTEQEAYAALAHSGGGLRVVPKAR